VNWFIGIAAFIVIWWVVIFAVLPWGIRPAGESGKGYDAGAPANPRIVLKVLITTAIAVVIWVGFFWAATHDLVSFR
jgi:predicted secreted protein